AILLEVPAALPWVAAACWLLAALLFVVAQRASSNPRFLLSVVLGATVAGLMLTSASAAAPGRWPDSLCEATATGAVLRGTISTTQTVYNDDTRFDASLSGWSIAGNDFDGAVQVLVFGTVEEPV